VLQVSVGSSVLGSALFVVQSKPKEPAVGQVIVGSTVQPVKVWPVKQQYVSLPPTVTGSLHVPSAAGGAEPVGQLKPLEPVVVQVTEESAWQLPPPPVPSVQQYPSSPLASVEGVLQTSVASVVLGSALPAVQSNPNEPAVGQVMVVSTVQPAMAVVRQQ
jgi:hypothetical protein